MSYPHYYYAHPSSAMHDDEFAQPRRHRFGPGPRPFRPDPYARLASPSPAPYRPSHAGFYRDAPAHVSPYARYYAAEDDDDDDALLREEEEARHHLELIQRRREAARLAAERDRAERAHRAEYEAFVAAREAAARRAREDTVKREVAQQQALARQREAEARARAQAAEKERLRKEIEKQVKLQILAQQQAEIQAQKEQLARQQRQQREAEARRQREEQLQAQHAARQAFLEHVRKQQQQRHQQQAAAARSACARPRIEARPSHPLLALFAPEHFAAEEKKKEVKPAPTPEPVKTAPSTPPPAPTPKKDEAPHAVPQGLNDLLSHFLGLQIDHADKNEKAADTSKDGADSTKVIDGLNELLGQFGLVFEPEGDQTPSEVPKAESSKKAVENKPATPEPAPANRAKSPCKPACECSHPDNKSFEPATYGLPDFLKYAFEAAMNDGCTAPCAPAAKKADKGKGVAEGEKKPRAQPASPAPKPASAAVAAEPAPEPKATPADSISKLKSIANEFALARESFTFPDRLVFGPTATASDPQHPPALLFNKTNSPYHAQTNKLLQLLLAADNVTSDGDTAVRQERKALVKELEKEIELLERKRDQVWEEVRGQRERGEEEIEVESVSSGASVVDPIEHAEHHGSDSTESDGVIVEAPVDSIKAEEASQPASEPAAESAPETEIAGFDVPAVATEKAAEPEQHAEPAEHQGEAVEDDTPAEVKSEEKASEPTTPLPELERKQSRQATVEDETQDEYEVL